MRTRKVVLSDDVEQNVKTVATYRLNNSLKSIGTFGQCFGANYHWTPDQIDRAEAILIGKVEQAMTNIRTGKALAAAGIQL